MCDWTVGSHGMRGTIDDEICCMILHKVSATISLNHESILQEYVSVLLEDVHQRQGL